MENEKQMTLGDAMIKLQHAYEKALFIFACTEIKKGKPYIAVKRSFCFFEDNENVYRGKQNYNFLSFSTMEEMIAKCKAENAIFETYDFSKITEEQLQAFKEMFGVEVQE